MTSSEARHAWLEAAAIRCGEILQAAGYAVPERTRVSIGFAFGKRTAVGQCWDARASSDGHFEIVVSPVERDGLEIMGTLIHELIHAVLGSEAGHGPKFKKAAHAVGLTGKMRSTTTGPALLETFKRYVADVGAYPAGAVNTGASAIKPQTTRLLKAACGDCGYTVRVTRKWVEDAGAPHCPHHGEMSIAA